MSEFTKGPWIADDKGFITADGVTIAQLFDNPDSGIDPMGSEQSDYNQALICSAPELYEMVKLLLSESHPFPGCRAFVGHLTANKARELLTKANPQAK